MPQLSPTDLLADPPLNEVAAAALLGDQADAWSCLQRQIAIICTTICRGAKALADEITQRTSIKVVRARGTSAGYRRGRNFRPWCARIASNALNDVYRETQRRRESNPDEHAPDPQAPIAWSGFYDDASPLGGADLEASNGLFSESPEAAVQVFAVTWFWRLLPEGLWEKWLNDPRISIAPPWPPQDVLQHEDPKRSILCITATAFGIAPDSVRRNVERQRGFLLKLSRAKVILGYKE